MKPKKVAPKKARTSRKPQVVIEVGPAGLFRWQLNLLGRQAAKDSNKAFLVDLARDLKNAIAASGGRAELVVKNRRGQIEARDSGGHDPKESKG